MATNSEISLYVDALIVETIAADRLIVKNAEGGLIGGMLDKVKDYISAHINPSDKVGSFLNIIAPGAILVTFSALGMPWIGRLLGLAFSVFHIDVAGILKSIFQSIKSIIGGGGQATSDQIDGVVSQAVSAGTGPATAEEALAAQHKLQLPDSDIPSLGLADDGTFNKSKSIASELRYAKILKLAMIQYDKDLTKNAGIGDFLNIFSSKKAATSTILSRVLSFFFKIALASAGLMVAGDIINSMLGRSSALSGTMQAGQSTLKEAPHELVVAPAFRSTQTKFKLNPSYHEESYGPSSRWFENYRSTRNGIEDMVIDFANDVYSDLNDKEDLIRSAPGFKSVVDIILFNNARHTSQDLVSIPTKVYHSKRNIADTFIDDVARRA